MQPWTNLRARKRRLKSAWASCSSCSIRSIHDRDLDHDADEYSSAGLRKPRCSFRSSWSFICRRASYGAPISPALERAIHNNYFAYQQQQSRRRLHLIFHDGRIALAVGIAFLFVCILIRQVAYSFGSGTASKIIAEGILIAGWVAMWRPLDTFLYDWWPIRRRARVLGKLAEMPVVVRAT